MKIRKNKIVLLQTRVFVVLAVACLAFAGCKKPVEQKERPPAGVEVSKSVEQSIPVIISCFGQMISDENVTIMPQVSGMLMDVGFEDGGVGGVGVDELTETRPARLLALRVWAQRGEVAMNNNNRPIALACKRIMSPSLAACDATVSADRVFAVCHHKTG